MKNTFVTAFTLLAMGMLLIINPAFAGDRVKVYEMAESGALIEFPVKKSGKVVLEAVAEKKSPDDSKM